MIIFLDFDGVLHPDNVYLSSNGPRLMGDGTLFMWAPILVEELASFPEVKLVLSTSWVRHVGFSRAMKRLPAQLRQRVVGATWHSSMSKAWADEDWWDQASRYGQIMKYVAKAGITDWLALDDDDAGWNLNNRQRLIPSCGSTGLSNQATIKELRSKLISGSYRGPELKPA